MICLLSHIYSLLQNFLRKQNPAVDLLLSLILLSSFHHHQSAPMIHFTFFHYSTKAINHFREKGIKVEKEKKEEE